jgi:hypothetical protein
MKRAFQSPSQFLFETFFPLINIWRITLENRAGTRTSVLSDFHQNYFVSKFGNPPPPPTSNYMKVRSAVLRTYTTITAVRRQVNTIHFRRKTRLEKMIYACPNP